MLHSLGETLSSLARYFVFPQSAERVVPMSASGCEGTQPPSNPAQGPSGASWEVWPFSWDPQQWCSALPLREGPEAWRTASRDPTLGDVQKLSNPSFPRGSFNDLWSITHSHQQTGEVQLCCRWPRCVFPPAHVSTQRMAPSSLVLCHPF